MTPVARRRLAAVKQPEAEGVGRNTYQGNGGDGSDAKEIAGEGGSLNFVASIWHRVTSTRT